VQFSNIQGLDRVKNSLIEAVRKDHVAHAQLFLGAEGSANLALAIAFATYLNCEDPGPSDSCGVCASCLKNQKYIHPDVHYIFPVCSTEKIKGKEVVSNNFLKEWRVFLEEGLFGDITDWSMVFGGENKNLNISKEESRQIIQKLSLKAFEGKYKILIIWMPEYMHPSAANGLLKVLEEPSERTVFLWVSQDAEKLLGTILSRTQKVMVRKFNDLEIQQQLKAAGVAEEKAAHIARLSGGNLKLAQRLASEGDEDHGVSFKEWMRLCYGGDYKQLVNWSEDFHKMNKISQKGFLRFGLSLLRDTLLVHYGDSSLIRLDEAEKEFVRKFSNVVTPEIIEPLNLLFTEALFHLERNGSAKMIFLDLSLKATQQLKTRQLDVQN
jgi:DNA polymerase-3 subunit delta'